MAAFLFGAPPKKVLKQSPSVPISLHDAGAAGTYYCNMVAIVGILIVLGSVIGGYLLEHGKLAVLFQPAELVIIGGAALGSLVIANPVRVLKGLITALMGSLTQPYTKLRYLQTLKMLHDLFSSARKQGAQRLEADIEQPDQSPVFSQHPEFLKDHHSLTYLCDTLRTVLMGGVAVHELEALMELDSEIHHAEDNEPVAALQMTADALPGLGIVAAVLGVVITMGALGGPPEEIGHKVAAALVGTFLGVLLCYGFVGPLASKLTKTNEAKAQYQICLRNAVLAYVRGFGPLLAVEFARRTIPPHVRPTFKEYEEHCRNTGAPAAPPAEEAAA
jgi:chemotaxis protein MotA